MTLPNLPPLTLGGAAGPSASPLHGYSGVFDGSGWSVNFRGNQTATATGSAPVAPKATSLLTTVAVISAVAFGAWKLIK